MTDRERRRQLRDQARSAPPDAGVIVVRHAATGRRVVTAVENLAGARNRFAFALATGTLSALPDPHLAADARAHGTDGLSLEVLETVAVEPGADMSAVRRDLDTLVSLWRERLEGDAGAG
jgi:hypothetical protein